MVLAFVALGWIAPAARASCGDYVVMHSQPAEPVSQVLSHPAANAARLALLSLEVPRSACSHCPARPDAPPCRGPWCSGNSQPINVPMTTVDRPHETWAIAGVGTRLDNSRPMPFVVNAGDGRCHVFVFRVYHPPRA